MDVEAEGRVAAERFRDQHHLGWQPLGDLVAIIEQVTGIDVAVLDVGPDEHGLTVRDPRRDIVFIGVARTRHPMRQRSTLAHELGHVLFKDWGAGSGKSSEQAPEEIRCRAFARHLLVPVKGLQEFLGHREELNLATLSAVVQRFLASPAIVAVALQNAGYIGARTKQDWEKYYTPQLATRFGWSDQYRALQVDSNQRRAPQGLLARAITGYSEGVVPAQVIATLRGISLQDAEQELRDAGVVPAEQPIPWAQADELPQVDVDLAALDQDLRAPEPDDQDVPQKGRPE